MAEFVSRNNFEINGKTPATNIGMITGTKFAPTLFTNIHGEYGN